ncbi:tripartite tricarboxylate transporter substrate binding protein [Curvibacter sp. RS43]|uniref:Bug family tripartite tricarboxylate transporter substrate binding protein n=1 Tax=Curvibacter microcysteis TaxID=3026419 RepID=UPI0023620E1E|nr:tripartite tricarboxylate transporter substrate binding protein [Curvibacter sp. RS43]MDD0812933.1 tripartite tricarboxylate transporter substrate binding protein [Curvibacter sp. RS43]
MKNLLFPILRYLLALAFVLVLTSTGVLAAYPDKPLHIVLPFPAGAAADAAMRVVATRLSEQLKQPVIIDNKPGAPGFQSVASAPADGYTLILGAGSHIVTEPMIKTRLAYQPERDLTPVGMVLTNTPVFTATPSLGVKSLGDLLGLLRSKPGELNYSSGGVGSPNHLAMEAFQQATGTRLVNIPYKGGAPSVNDLVAGHVQVGINAIPSVIQHIQAGKLQPLAVAATRRHASLPLVPTFSELGVNGLEYEIWYGLFAPAKTPKALVQQINQALQACLGDSGVVRQLRAQGAEPSPGSAEALATYIRRDTEKWRQVIRQSGIRPE